MKKIFFVAGIIICCLLATTNMAAKEKKDSTSFDAVAVLKNGNHCSFIAPTSNVSFGNDGAIWSYGVEYTYVKNILRAVVEVQIGEKEFKNAPVPSGTFINLGLGICPITNPNIKVRPSLMAKFGYGEQNLFQCEYVEKNVSSETLNGKLWDIEITPNPQMRPQSRLEGVIDFVLSKRFTLAIKGGGIYNFFEGSQLEINSTIENNLDKTHSWVISAKNMSLDEAKAFIKDEISLSKFSWYVGASLKIRFIIK